MLRFLLIFLLLANALAFAAVLGWLGGTPTPSEPERVSKQIQPESILLAGEASPTSEATEITAEPPVPAPEHGAAATDNAGTAEPATIEAPPTPEASSTPTEDTASESATTTDVAAAPAPAPAPQAVCAAWAQLSATEADQLATRLRRADVRFTRSRSETPGSWWVRIGPQASQEQAEQRVRELRALGVQDSFIVQEAGPNRHAVSLGVFKTEGRARVLLNQLRARGVRGAELIPRMTTSFRIQAQLQPAALRGIESGVRALATRRVPCTQP